MAKKEKQFNLDGLEQIANEKPAEAAKEIPEVLTDKQLENAAREVELEREFGDQDLRTFLESGASAASFGISDQIIAKYGGEEMQQALRERRQRNEEAALAGEVAGTVLPALGSGGTSLAAKGASAGIRGAAKAGQFVEKLTAKQLAKVINETGKKKLAKEVIKRTLPKTAGSAVEGAFYGAGELIKEDALGTAEFNAENLVASAGAGAVLGGAVGGLFGSAEALVPVVKNNKIVDYAAKKVNTNLDRRMASAKLSKMTPTEISKLKDTKWGQEIYDNMPTYYKDNLELKVGDNLDTIFRKSEKEIVRLGEEIGETAKKIDKIAQGTNVLPARSQVANRVQQSLKEVAEQLGKSPDELSKKSLKKVQNRIKSWDDWLNNDNPITAVEIKELKTNLQKAAKWNKSIDQIPLDGKMDRKVAEAVRQEFMDLADKVSTVDTNLGSKLRKLNLDYGTGMAITNKLKRAVDKEAASEGLKFKDLLVADILTDTTGGFGAATGAVAAKKFLESDFRRKLTILTDIEKANNKISKTIKNSVNDFFSGAKRAAVPTSTKILLSTSFDLPDDSGRRRKKPKTKLEAFKNISEDLVEMKENPQKLIDHLSKNSMRLTGAAPSTAVAIDSTLSSAVNFLFDKLPKDPSPGTGLFARKWEPSSLEIAKFERYLEAVENPMAVLKDLGSNSLSREGIEVLQSVYPDLYQRVQEQVIDHIAKNPDISYQKRLNLGIALDLPADTSLMSQNIAALQQQFADQEQQQNAAVKEESAVPTTQGGLGKLNFSDDAKSNTEKVSTRE